MFDIGKKLHFDISIYYITHSCFGHIHIEDAAYLKYGKSDIFTVDENMLNGKDALKCGGCDV